MVDENENDLLKDYIKEIIDDHFLSRLHELKKKLSMADRREKDLLERLDRYEKDVEQFKGCHDCHRVNVEKREVATQTFTETSTSSRTSETSSNSPDKEPPTEGMQRLAETAVVPMETTDDNNVREEAPEREVTTPKPNVTLQPDVITIDDSD